MKKRVLLTPSLAREYLSHNYKRNRKLSVNTVQAYASDILSGRWNEEISEYDQPIAFSTEGELINGQHRCQAVIRANKAIYVWIVTDVSIELYNYMDCGKVRSARDFLSVPNSNSVATLAKFVCAVEEGNTTLNQAVQGIVRFVPGKNKSYIRVTRSQIIQKVEEDNEYLQMLSLYGQRASKHFGNKRGPFSNAFYVIDYLGKGELLEEFVSECSKALPESEIIIGLRTYMANRIMLKSFNATPQWVMGCIFFAYEHFVDDTPINSFNKVEKLFDKYSALVNKERNRRKEI